MKKGLGLLLVLGLLWSSSAYAEDVNLEVILEKLKAVEKENMELRSELRQLKGFVKENIKAKGESSYTASTYTVESSVPLKVYGFIRADMIYSDSNTTSPVFTAPSEPNGSEERSFRSTARDTRIGLKLGEVPVGYDGKLVGQIEGDFAGTSSDLIRLRLAYISLIYNSFSITAGKTWDFFSPLNPAMVNVGVLWYGGNLGIRHGQVYITKTFSDVGNGLIKFQAGVLDTERFSEGAILSGKEANSRPAAAARIAYEKKTDNGVAAIGVGGLYTTVDTTSSTKDQDMWAVTGDVKLPITKKLALAAEAYVGAGLARFMAGSSVGIDNGKMVKTKGGWAQLSYKATDKATLNIGGGIDDPDAKNTASTDIYDYNKVGFANIQYKITDSLLLSLEIQRFLTKYYNKDGGDANRIQTSIQYNF